IGLAAASLSGLGAAWVAARVGRRPVLAITGVLMALTGLDLAFAQQAPWLVAAGVTGMLGVASVDLGPFASVEQAALTEAAAPATGEEAMRAFFLLDAAIGLVTAGLPLGLSSRVEAQLRGPAFAALRRPETRRVLVGLAALFALDSFAGGFVTNSVISYWLH